MATTLTVDDFFELAEETYGDLVVPGKDKEGDFVVRLQPLLRLPQESRDAIEDLLITRKDEEGEEGEKERPNPVKTLQDFIRLVADDAAAADRLIVRIGDRADVLKTIQESWFKHTQPGEAKPSSN